MSSPMSQHLQDQILASLKDTLLEAGIVAPDCVHLEGVDELPVDATPALRIDAGPETVANLTLKPPRTQKRVLDVFITIVVAQNTDFRLRAGCLLAKLEETLSGTPEARGVGGVAPEGLQLVATEPDRDGNAARIVYSIRTLWRVTYLCREGAPRSALAA